MDHLIPRLLSSLLTGVIISQTGSLIQMSTRNILASPSTLGFDGLSVLWILIFHSFLLLFGQDWPAPILFLTGLPVFCLVGWIFSRFIGKQRNIDRLILIGLTFNLLVGAVFSLWQFLFLSFNLPFPVELWFGHFRFSDFASMAALLAVESAILIGGYFLRKEFQLYSLGRSVAANLSSNQNLFYLFIFTSISIGTFGVISLFGAFSFLGLIFPILSRRFWFHKMDLPGEFLFGAFLNGILLMLIDALCYFFPIYGAEVPVGLISTAVGAVSLICLLWRSDSHLEILAKTGK